MATTVGEVLVRISADDAVLQRILRRSSTSVDSFGSRLEKLSGPLQTLGGQMSALSLPIVAAGLAAGKFAIDHERALGQVGKTTGATQAQLHELAEGFTALSESFAVEGGFSTLTGIAASGGALGIANENLQGFVDTVAKLDVAAESLTSDEAATGLARFANVAKTSQTDFDRLGSVIADLGNNGASTEAEILAMGQRLVGAGRLANMTEGEILGFANALASVGVEAEAGGTAFSKIFTQIGEAAATGGKSLADLAQVAGISATEFQKLAKTDAARAVTLFVEGLGKIHKAGGNVTQTLSALGIEEARMRMALLNTAQAGDLLRESVERGNTAWKENTALNAEAARANETTWAQLIQAKNALVNLAAEMGAAALPMIRAFADQMKSLVTWFRSLSDGAKTTVVVIAGVTASIGPLLLITGQLAQAFVALRAAMLLTGASAAISQVLASTGAFLSLATAVRSTADAAALTRIGFAGVAGMIGPQGLLVAGLAAVAYGFWRIGESAREAGQQIEEAVRKAKEGLPQLAGDDLRRRVEMYGTKERELYAQFEAKRQAIIRLEAQGVRSGGPGGAILARMKQDLENLRFQYRQIHDLAKNARAELQGRRTIDGITVVAEDSTVDPAPITPTTETKKTATQLLGEEVQRLAEGLRLRTLNVTELTRAVQLERELTQRARDTNLTLEQRNAAASGAGSLRDAGITERFGVVELSPANVQLIEQAKIQTAGLAIEGASVADAFEEVNDVLGEMAGRVRGIAGLGRAFGLVGDNAQRAADDVANLLEGAQKYSEGSFTSVLGALTSGGALQMMGAAASLLSGLGGMLGDGNAEWKEAINRNTSALDQMRMDLAGFKLDFGTQAGIGKGLDALLAKREYLENSARGTGGRDTSNRQKNRAEDILDDFGLTLKEVNALAEKFGIDLYDDNGALIMGAVAQLREAISLSADAIKKYGATMEGQARLLEVGRNVFDREDPLSALQDAYAVFSRGLSDELEAELGILGLDLSTGEGQAALEAGLRELFTRFSAGELDASMLDGFESVSDFLQHLGGTDSALDALAKAAGKATGAMQNIPTVLNLQLFRFRASTVGLPDPVTVPRGGGGTRTPPGTGPAGGSEMGPRNTFSGNTFVFQGVEDIEDFFDRLERVAADREARGSATRLGQGAN